MHIHYFLVISPLYNAVRIITTYLRHSDQCVYVFQQNVVYFTNLCHLVREIYTFFEKHAKNLNAHSEKLGELGLTAGI
jgi:hypothetical protein